MRLECGSARFAGGRPSGLKPPADSRSAPVSCGVAGLDPRLHGSSDSRTNRSAAARSFLRRPRPRRREAASERRRPERPSLADSLDAYTSPLDRHAHEPDALEPDQRAIARSRIGPRRAPSRAGRSRPRGPNRGPGGRRAAAAADHDFAARPRDRRAAAGRSRPGSSGRRAETGDEPARRRAAPNEARSARRERRRRVDIPAAQRRPCLWLCEPAHRRADAHSNTYAARSSCSAASQLSIGSPPRSCARK